MIYTINAFDRMTDKPSKETLQIKPFSLTRDLFLNGFIKDLNIGITESFSEIFEGLLPETMSTDGGKLPFRYYICPVLKEWEAAGKINPSEMIANCASILFDQLNGGEIIMKKHFHNEFLCSLDGQKVWIDITYDVYGEFSKVKPMWLWSARNATKPKRYYLPFIGTQWD